MNEKIKSCLRKKDWAQYLSLCINAKRPQKKSKKIKNLEKHLISDYKQYYGVKPNLDNPKKYSEFLLWQKLNMKNNTAALLTDKIISKSIVTLLFGDEINYPKTLDVYKNAREIKYENLPEECVIKCNHNSGYAFHFIKNSKRGYTIKNLRDKHHTKYSLFFVKRILNKLLKINYYYKEFEWNYKDIIPRIFVEEYLAVSDLREYKFYMSMGELTCFHVVINRQTDERNNFFDERLNPLDYWADVPPTETPPPLPNNIEKMIDVAKKLSRDYPALRIDLYNIGEKIYFGEATFFHMGGHLVYKSPENFDELMGKKMRLPIFKKKQNEKTSTIF